MDGKLWSLVLHGNASDPLAEIDVVRIVSLFGGLDRIQRDAM